MTTEQLGAYVLLLILEWQEVGFDDDPDLLAKWCRMSRKRFDAMWPILKRCFVLDASGRYVNPRLHREREKQKAWREKSAEGGKKGAATRWPKDNHPDKGGDRVVTPTEHTPFLSPSPIPELPTTPTTTAARSQTTRTRARGQSDQRTWLTPFGHAWDAEQGAGSFDYGQAARELKPLLAHHTADEICRRLTWYLQNRGSESALSDRERARVRFTPSIRDFRLRFKHFDPSAPDAEAA